MPDITYFDRKKGTKEKEKVYGHFFLELLYGDGRLYRCLSFFLLPLFSRISLLSHLYGCFQKSKISRRKIKPFIRAFNIDTSEFLEPVDAFCSFDAFFTRHLRPNCRPIATGDEIAILPADARYLVYPRIDHADGFWVKGKKFSLTSLLQSEELAERYAQGAMVMARLCPVDYHRFHFPCDCHPGKTELINGALYSVNPIALQRKIEILSENKRMITELRTNNFGQILYIEVGATHVGSIHQTFAPGAFCAKGAEKGYFSFGGSCLILLFEPNTILFDRDFIDYSSRKMEVFGQLGQSLGRSLLDLNKV